MGNGGVPALPSKKSETLKRSVAASKLAVLCFSCWTIRDYQEWSLGLLKESRGGRGGKKGRSSPDVPRQPASSPRPLATRLHQAREAREARARWR